MRLPIKAMSQSFEQVIKEAKVTNVPVISGSDEEGNPKFDKKETDLWEVDLSESLNRSISVHAKNEEDARKKVIQHLEEEQKAEAGNG